MNRVYVYGLRENTRYTLVRGDLRTWLMRHEIPALWTPRLKGWCIRSERVGDVIAQAEIDGYSVRMKGALQ